MEDEYNEKVILILSDMGGSSGVTQFVALL